jgi:hypothetical protein
VSVLVFITLSGLFLLMSNSITTVTGSALHLVTNDEDGVVDDNPTMMEAVDIYLRLKSDKQTPTFIVLLSAMANMQLKYWVIDR